MSKKDFKKFQKVNTHKRRAKEKARRELLGILDSINIGYSDGIKLGTQREGRGARSGARTAEEILSEGIYEGSRAGYGFVRLSGAERDIFIPKGKSFGAVDGDTVEVSYKKYRAYTGDERTEGRVKRIIRQGSDTLTGELCAKEIRMGRRYRREFYIEPHGAFKAPLRVSDLGGARVGDIVLCKIMRGGEPYCDIIRSLGAAGTKDASYEAILLDEGIECEFSPEVISMAERLAREPISAEGRLDLRDEVIFTIDSESAKDLDDAVSIKKTRGGYTLSVHIADVSHYIPEKSALERCAVARGTSVYFVDKVVPMLPEALSNGACSLNAGEDKYALSAVIELDSSGEIKKCKIAESVINSRVRGVYSEINRLLSGEKNPALSKKYKPVSAQLERMVELYEILKRKSVNRGAIDFDAPECEFLLSPEGEVSEIVRRERGLSERIIEQFMLTANEAVATELRTRGIPCVYRIHEMPPEDKLSQFITYMQNLGFNVGELSRNPESPAVYADLLSGAEERGILTPVSYTLLRTMSKARYSEIHHSHFGLGIENYCHFTSPIRRLSDLATHRIIKRVLISGKRGEAYASFARRCAVAATEGELRAVSAERRIENLYKALYMSHFVGEEFDAVVSSVTQFGLFCSLDNTAEGIVPISDLPFGAVFEERTMKIRCHTESFSLGDKIRVRLVECDIARGKMRFEPVWGAI